MPACDCTSTAWTTDDNYLADVDLTKTIRISGTFTLGVFGLRFGVAGAGAEVYLVIEPTFVLYAAALVYDDYGGPVDYLLPFNGKPVAYLGDTPFAEGDTVSCYLCWDGQTQQATAKVELVP